MFSKQLKSLKEENLFREIKNRTSPQGPRIIIGGEEYINFSSNDYLGLANHPDLIRASQRAMEKFGFGSGASRLLCGGSSLHEELEKKTAKFKGTESALVFNSGYAANTGIIPVIAGEGDAIFSDELNHASIIDGCRLSRAKTYVYKHKDTEQLERFLKMSDGKQKIVVTDSVFSMDGDIAPLKRIHEICKEHNAILYIDDAHATGVLGNGRGALSYLGIKPYPWIIQMGTFSKALGSFGAFVAGSKDTIDWIINTARSFMFSTALPPCVIGASIASLDLVEKNSALIDRLWANRDKTVKGMSKLGYNLTDSETPIIPLKSETVEDALEMSRYLFKKGIVVPAIRPPTVKEPRIRITVTAAHTDGDIDRLIETLNSFSSR